MRTLLKNLAIIILAGTALSAGAQPGKSNGNSNRGNTATGQVSLEVTIGISTGEARRIAIDLGLTGYDGLPPGIAKNVARGKPLPPGIAKQYPPRNMLGRLPEVDDHEWRISGKDLILIAIGTAIVVEVLEEVFD